MEGRFYLLPLNSKRDKHDYVIFYFDDYELHFNDPRLFGKMEVVLKEDIDKFFNSKKLGLEYTDPKLTVNYLKEKFKTHHTDIKKMLLDQSYITGIGNIYADEVLFASKINPLRLGESVTLEECKRIIKSARDILSLAIKEGGTTIRSYTSSLGVTGNYQNFLKVHKKEGELCTCGCKIEKIKVGGRSTYFCPNCQK